MAKPRLWVPLLTAFLVTLTDSVNLENDAIANKQNVANAVADYYVSQLTSSDSKRDESLMRVFPPNKTNTNYDDKAQKTDLRRHLHPDDLTDVDEINVRKAMKILGAKLLSKAGLKSPAKSHSKRKGKTSSKRPVKVNKGKKRIDRKKPVKVRKVKGKKVKSSLLKSKKNYHSNKKLTYDYDSDEEAKSVTDYSDSTYEDNKHQKERSKKLKSKKRHNQGGKNVHDYDTDEESKSVDYSDESDGSSITGENSDYDPSNENDSSYSSSSSSKSGSSSNSGSSNRKLHSSSSSSSHSSSDSDYTDEKDDDHHHHHHRGRCGFLGCGKPSTRQRATALIWKGVKSEPGMSAPTVPKKKPNNQRAGMVLPYASFH